MTVNDIIDWFNSGEEDIRTYFNDYVTFFNMLQNRNLLDRIDPAGPNSDVWQNEFLIWCYQNDKKKFYELVTSFLGDVEIQDNKAILVRSNRTDLADLFCDGRNDVSKKTIENILSDEGDWFEFYDNTTDDVYRDVIDELNEKNLKSLKEYILKELAGQQLSPETSEMELLAAEQGHDDYWEITPDNVARIIDDEESMMSLLGDELSDLKSELYNIHSNAYNNAAMDGIYEEIWNELGDYFIADEMKWVNTPHPLKKDTTIQKFTVPINDFENNVLNFLEHNKGYSDGTLEYWGSYLGILGDSIECLSVRFPDYPDSRTVDKYINEFFGDYI